MTIPSSYSLSVPVIHFVQLLHLVNDWNGQRVEVNDRNGQRVAGRNCLGHYDLSMHNVALLLMTHDHDEQ